MRDVLYRETLHNGYENLTQDGFDRMEAADRFAFFVNTTIKDNLKLWEMSE